MLRTQLEGRPSFVDYLQQCREEDLAAFDHQLYRFEALAEAIGADRTTAINPIFQIMLVYQAKVDFNDLIPGCQLVEETSPVLPAKTDISVKVTELMDSVRVDWLFATALFERETIQALADRLLHLMRAVVAAPRPTSGNCRWRRAPTRRRWPHSLPTCRRTTRAAIPCSAISSGGLFSCRTRWR